MRYLTGVVILMAAGMACARAERPVAALPTSPSTAMSADSTITFVGGVSGPMDVLFPSRGDSFQFRNELETKYQTGLNRSATTSYVDREGEVVWTQEYIRYRVNGCDHATAAARVMTQIDGGAAGGICSSPPAGVVNFPSRADSLAFRRELETKYQQMNRGLSSTFVDSEGGVIWTQEYLRYRANGCDHTTAVSKVFSQIDGGPVPAICTTACAFVANPTAVTVGSAAASSTFEIRPNPTGCDYTAASDASWLTISSEYRTGNNFTVVPYSVTANNGSGRTGRITITWASGSTQFTVFQEGTPFASSSFTMTDPFRSGGTATSECWFRSTSTPCNFTSATNLPGSTYTYSWRATYQNVTAKTFTGTGATFSFSDSCGGGDSNAEGSLTDLNVTLTITDERGNTITLRSGEGNQPALRVRRFTC